MRTVDLREQEIFLEAIEINSPVARMDHVYQSCGPNINLRDRVVNLINLQGSGSFILDKEITLDSKGNITTDPGIADLTGQTVGRYHLVRLLGSGGMGDVYLAEQKEPIRRRVAVKVIKLGMDTKSFVARFAAERQALAVMDHQGITKVFDAGSTKTGRPYFAMELVSGEPITVFCDENRLNLEERIEIFRDLCKAMQHAHQKGLIHRDLKPSNILVSKKEGEYVSKVIDFGVSKATHGRMPGHTDLTKLACMIGTPDYMSPEQTDTQGNDQDIRTDIYSLGAILYELLAGSTTFELEELKSKNLFTIREIIQTRAVEAPSQRVLRLLDKKPQIFRDREMTSNELTNALKGNLDAITLKCLSKDRNERFSSVAELEADLERHLNGEHVAIVRQSAFSYYQRQLAKHKWAVIVSSLLATFLISVSVFSLMSAARANRYAEKAIKAEALSKQRTTELVNARRDAQLEKSRSRSFEKRYKALDNELRNEEALLKAIASFNRLKDRGYPDITVSRWLKTRLSDKISDLLPNGDSKTAQQGDTMLLQLIAAKQREAFGATDVKVAETLDLLGEKYLSSRNYSKAIESLRESLFIYTENDNDSEERLRSMILLAKALRLDGAEDEAVSYIKTIRRHLENMPLDSRLHQMVKEFKLP